MRMLNLPLRREMEANLILFDARIYSGQRVEQIGAGEEMDIGKQSVGRIACCYMSNK